MPYLSHSVCGLCAAVLLLAGLASASNTWLPIQDEVYLQEIGSQIPTESRVWSVAVHQGVLYAGFGDTVRALDAEGALAAMPGAPQAQIHRLESDGEALWAFTNQGLYCYTSGKWRRASETLFCDLCMHLGQPILAAKRGLYRVEGDQLHLIPGSDALPVDIQAIDSYSGTIYGLGFDTLFLFDGKAWQQEGVIEWGALPSKDLRDLAAYGSKLLIGAHQGVGVLRGTAATQLLGADGLACEETRRLVPGFARDCWIATPEGALRYVEGGFHFFTGKRWLPDNGVNDIAIGDQAVYCATNAGIGVIHYEPYTLLKKAAYYERHLREWGQLRLGFTHCLMWEDGGWVREVSDNDIGWSTHYWAAQAFKYAATGDEEARQKAVDGFKTMKWSEEITSIKGFPARSIWANGETGHRTTGGSGGYPAEWNPTEDGKWSWKGDTSSDETDSQYYYASIFYELVANEKEKEQVRDHLRRMTGHLVDNGFTLIDLDGKPTIWARWDEAYFNGQGKPHKGLNGLEILSYLRCAYEITGEDRFLKQLEACIAKEYLEKVVTQKLTFSLNIFHSDDRLAFYTYYTLLRHEKDPYLRGLYLRSLERSWEIERMEQVPWFNFIYGALTGNDCETAQAVRHLRETPLDLRVFGYDVSSRRDIAPGDDYIPYCKVEMYISPRIRGLSRWSYCMGKLKSGGNGTVVEDPAGWLDAYWMGRYYGMILPPETTDPALISVPERNLQLGAVPYDGPPRPVIWED